jgi:hypothetical protein
MFRIIKSEKDCDLLVHNDHIFQFKSANNEKNIGVVVLEIAKRSCTHASIIKTISALLS